MTRSILREYSLLAWVFVFGTDSTAIVAQKFHNWPYAVCIQKSGCHSSSRVSEEVAHFALRKIVEKEIDRSNATVPGDDKIGSRVSWWFAGSARYPSNPSGMAAGEGLRD